MNATKKAPVTGYSLRGVKTFMGMDGHGLNATLLRDGKAVCTLIDEGCGGEMHFDWHDMTHGESKESDLFEAFIAVEKEKLDATKKNEYGMTEKDYFDGAMWVNTLVDKLQNDKKFKRVCKTTLLFQVGDEIGSDAFRTVKGLQFRPQIEKKYAGQKIVFMNDEFKA